MFANTGIQYNISTLIRYFLFAIINFMICVIYVTFLVFSLIALSYTPYSDFEDLCPCSNLWYYLLCANVFCLLQNILFLSYYVDETILANRAISGFLLLFQFALFGWGLYEFYGVPCIGDLKSYLIYQLSYMFMIYNNIICCILVIIVQCFITFMVYSHYN